jgi:hypothetical protein
VKGKSTFNTIWLQFPYGSGLKYWSLQTGLPESKVNGTGWQFAYQNFGSLIVGLFGMNTSLHTISLAEPLVAGNTYRLLLNGRSAQVTIYRILLSLCTGTDCGGTGTVWDDIRNATASRAVTRCS